MCEICLAGADVNPPFQTARNFLPLQFHHIHGKRTAVVEQQNQLPVAFAYYWIKS